jgi:hypothetical protein
MKINVFVGLHFNMLGLYQRFPTQSPLATWPYQCGEWFCFLIFQKCHVLRKMYKMLGQIEAFSNLIHFTKLKETTDKMWPRM